MKRRYYKGLTLLAGCVVASAMFGSANYAYAAPTEKHFPLSLTEESQDVVWMGTLENARVSKMAEENGYRDMRDVSANDKKTTLYSDDFNEILSEMPATKRISKALYFSDTEENLLDLQTKNRLVGSRVIANVATYVNVREEPSTSATIVGRFSNNNVGVVYEDKGEWVYIVSGNVAGYVVKDFLLTGDAAEKRIASLYQPKVKVISNILNVRAGAGTGFEQIDTFTFGKTVDFVEDFGEWIKISYNDGASIGFVSKQFVSVSGLPDSGETMQEVNERIAEEDRQARLAREAAEEKKRREEERIAEDIRKAKEALENDKQQALNGVDENGDPIEVDEKEALVRRVIETAMTALGKPYIWGGVDYSKGVDCSGLVYTAYLKNGIKLPRVSRDMAKSGALKSVSPDLDHLKPGDLIFYHDLKTGIIDHVAMYVGNGKIIHSADYGVVIYDYNYRRPHSAKRVIY